MKKTLLSLFAAFGMLASVCAENVSVIVDKADYTEDPQITGFAITDKNDILTGTAALEYGTHGNDIWSITFYVKEGTTKEALDASVTSDSFSFSPSDLQVQYLGNFLTGDYTAPISSNGVLFMVGDIQIWVYYEETMEEVEKPVINNGYQIPNSDFEAWVSDKEPGNGWNSFASAVGDMSWASSMSPAPQKVEGRNSGSAVELNSKNIFGKKANGNLTTGAINMGSMTPEDSTKNYNFTDLDNEGHYFLFKGTPDSVCLYAKFISGGSENGRGRFILHDKFEYQDPELSADSAHMVGDATILIPECGEWTRFSAPFSYTGTTVPEGEQYMLASLTTNPKAGGSANDTLTVDDIEIIYNSKLDSIVIAGMALEGFDKETYSYTVTGQTPSIDQITAYSDGKGASVDVAVNESVATITVKGNDFEVNPENQHVYTVTFNNTSAIDVVNAENITVSYANGLITVNGAEGAQAEVYTLAGQKVVQFICNGTTSVSLNRGAAYIVKVGNYRQTIIAF